MRASFHMRVGGVRNWCVRNSCAWNLAAVLAAVWCCVGVIAMPAAGQPANPRSQRPRISELERQLTEARAKIDELEQENAELQRQIDQLRNQLQAGFGSPASSSSPSPVTGGADPLSSLDAMFMAVRASYDEHFAEHTEQGASPAERELEAWAHLVGRRLEGKTRWLVQVALLPADDDDDTRFGPRDASVQIFDPMTLQPIGRAVTEELDARYARRVELAARGPSVTEPRVRPGVWWWLETTVKPEPAIVERTEPGPFDFPRLLAPRVEWGYSLKWHALIATTQADIEDAREEMRKEKEKEEAEKQAEKQARQNEQVER